MRVPQDNRLDTVVSERTLGLILAGGRSRRMGQDKAFVSLAGRPLIEHVVARLAPQVDALIISSNAPRERFAALPLPVLADVYGGFRGPLAGVHAALSAYPNDIVVSVAVDLPLLPPDLVERLKQNWDGTRCRYATAQGMEHALAILWPPHRATALEHYLRTAASVSGWLATQGEPVRFPPASAAALDINLNTPSDLARVETLLAHPAR